MNKIITLLLLILTLNVYSQVPCPNNNTYWLDLTPTGYGNTQTSACTYAGEYDTFTAILGVTYSISVCPIASNAYNTSFTLYNGSSSISFYSQDINMGNGCESYTWTSTFSGVVRIVVDNTNCGSNSKCTNVSVTQVSPSSSSGNQDCSNKIQICNNSSFLDNSSGYGYQELNPSNKGCMSSEHQSSWYSFQITTTGTISFTIVTSVDYDFAIWGPSVNCSSLGTPIRCSWAAGGGNTGLSTTSTDNSEGSLGDKWVKSLYVIAGESYIMLIDNYVANSSSFFINWSMSGGASLNCSVLPIELVSFDGFNYNTYNYITWVCATETNNDYFRLERSNDAFSWSTITNIKGAGTTNTGTMYSFKDLSFKKDYNYYRLTQVDYNGESKTSSIIPVDNTSNNLNKEIIKVINLMGQEVDINTPGILIYQYSDGTYDKVYKTKN